MDFFFQSYNPFKCKFDYSRVISRDTLHLIKYLRKEGHNVTVLPDDGSNLYIIKENAFWDNVTLNELLLQLTYATAGAAAYDILKNGILKVFSGVSDAIIHKLDLWRMARDEKSLGTATIERIALGSVTESLIERTKNFETYFKTVSPFYPSRQTAISLEHTYKIIGWGDFHLTETGGIGLRNVMVTDNETWSRVINKELKGISFGALLEDLECQICKKSYKECYHFTGKIYNDKECTTKLQGIDLAEFSFVKEPSAPYADIKFYPL